MVSKRCLCGCSITSAIFGITGLLLAILTGSIFDLIIKNFVLLGPHSMSKDMWINTPKLQTSVYIFEVQNKDDVIKGGKPKLLEKGPYVYDEYHHKTNLTWNSNGTVSYENVREYHFNPNDSNGTLDDMITIVNVPAGSISYTAKHMGISTLEKWGISLFLDIIKEKTFVHKKVSEIIFDGYEDPLLKDIQKLKDLLKALNVPIPPEMDKFAIFYKRNMSTYYDGVFNLYTGSLNAEKANQMYSWNYTNETPYFPDKCGKVWGNGELFKPFLPQSKVAMFSNDLCRPIIFKFEGTSSVKGISGNRYTLDDMFFANSTKNPDNWCFEAPKDWKRTNDNTSERLQFPSGVYNVGLCQFNSSAFISQPHFLHADEFYVNQFINGSLKPDEKKHETSIVIDPQSGIPLEVIARFQVNVLIEPSTTLTLFKGFKKPIFIPAFWFETKMTLPDELKLQMWALSNLQDIFRISGYIMFGLTIGALIVIAVYYHVVARVVSVKGPVSVEDSISNIVREDSMCSQITSHENEGTRDTDPILNT